MRNVGSTNIHLIYRTYQEKINTRKPCCRKETARCRSCSYRFKVQHSLQV